METQIALTSERAHTLTLHSETLDQNPPAVYLASLAQGSRRTMRESLDTIVGMLTNGQSDAFSFDWSALRFQHTAAIRSKLAEQYSAATANKMLSALRGCLKSCWRLGFMDAETYYRAVDVQNVIGSTLPAGRALSSGEIGALLDSCARDVTAAGARDAALLAILYSCGLRRAEICALELADYDMDTGALIVRGKRNKERTAYATNGSKHALEDWIAIRGNEQGALFCPIDKAGRVVIRSMHSEAIYFALAKRAAEAGIKDCSPHDMRRTFCGDLLDAGADISIVQRLMGHANPSTTARYDRRGEQAKRKAVGLLHVPYRARL